MEEELDHPLRPLRQRLGRVEVEEADQVDEEERREEGERDPRGARHSPVEPLEPVEGEGNQEEERDDVGERKRPRDLPLEFGERDGEDGREEQPLHHRGAGGDDARSVEGEGRHGVES